jgi:hypothetical protein
MGTYLGPAVGVVKVTAKMRANVARWQLTNLSALRYGMAPKMVQPALHQRLDTEFRCSISDATLLISTQAVADWKFLQQTFPPVDPLIVASAAGQ